jgi:YcxB-like protein
MLDCPPMPEVRAVKVTASLGTGDLHRANFSMALAATKSWRTLIISGFLCSMLFPALSLAYRDRQGLMWMALIGLLFGILLWVILTPIMLILSYVMLYFASRSFVRNNLHALGPITYEFSESGYSYSAVNGKGDVSWSAIPRIQETHKDFLLFYLKRASIVIPKRCFEGQPEIDSFKALLRGNYKGDLRLRK